MTLQDVLTQLFGQWRQVADETILRLGEQRAGHFVELYNDAIDIQAAVLDVYPREELLGSLVFADFIALFKELHWLQALFLCGNYPLAHRNLRFVWELLCRAYHADTYAADHPSEQDVPGPTVDEKVRWLAEPKRQLNWNTVIRPVLEKVLPAADYGQIHSRYRPLWGSLNQCVHPSSELRERLIEESALLVRDGFDEQWANKTLDGGAAVFDLLWIVLLTRFPLCCSHLTRRETFSTCPRASAHVKTSLPN